MLQSLKDTYVLSTKTSKKKESRIETENNLSLFISGKGLCFATGKPFLKTRQSIDNYIRAVKTT